MKSIIEIKIDELESDLAATRNRRDSLMSQGKYEEAKSIAVQMDQLRFTIKQFRSLL
jgi:hypothetical protein